MIEAPVKRRRKRKKKGALSHVVTEARKQKREMNRYLSEAISSVLGFKVEVRVKMDPAMSPDTKRAKRLSKPELRRYFADLVNAPLTKG